MKAFFDMMHEGPHKVMLFGAACTQVTDPIAKASKHWRITQVHNIIDLTHCTIIYHLYLANTTITEVIPCHYPAFKVFKPFVGQILLHNMYVGYLYTSVIYIMHTI